MTKIELRVMAHEGFRPHPYFDTVHKLTIGHGRNLSGKGISPDEALYLLRHDISDALDELNKYPWWQSLNGPRMGALIDMMVNIGPERFRGFHRMIDDLAAGHHDLAAVEMRESKWLDEVGKRAELDALQMETGEWSLSA